MVFMKKIILIGFLLFSVLGFSRYVEECRITSRGRGYLNCISLETGRRFNFTSGYLSGKAVGEVYKVYFEGRGYRNLYLYDAEYLY